MTELLNISELKKDPTQLIGKSDVCVIKYGKPVFHTVAPLRYEQLLRAERELNDLASKIMKGENE